MLKTQSKVLAAVLLVTGALILAGCPTRTTIEKINRDPGRYAGKEVTIAGHVTNSFGALGTGVFELEDDTGRMWVFSERYGVPGREARLAVTGRIEQGFSFGGRSFATILRETERRH
jgi:starvation-inducible outer membrane lipoprotein